MKLKPFLDAHYAPFCDRHHYWLGTTLIVKAVVLLCSAVTPADSANIVVYSVALASLVLTFWGRMVYCSNRRTLFHSWLLVNLSILNVTKLLNIVSDMSIASYTLIGLTMIQFLTLALNTIIKYTAIKWNETTCCKHGHEGDRLREEESDSDDSCGSLDSPKYISEIAFQPTDRKGT